MDTINKLQSLVQKDAKETRAWIKERNRNRKTRQASRKITLHIRKRMEELGWNREQLANKMEVQREEVDRWVDGKFDFKLHTIMQLSEVLKVDLITIKPFS